MLILSVINLCILAFGGVVDYKKREIPNLVPLTLAITAAASAAFLGWRIVLFRLAEAILVGAIFLLSGKLCGGELPGGDFKLLMALTFTSGIFVTGLTMGIVLVISFIIALFRQEHLLKRHIPLCTYVAPAYFLVSAATQIF